MINDTRQIEILVAHALPDLVHNVLIVVSVAVMLFCINWQLALLTLIPVPLVVLVGGQFSKRVAPLFRINPAGAGGIKRRAAGQSLRHEGNPDLGQEGTEHEKMVKRCKRYSEVNIRANFANAFFNPAVEFLTSLGTVIVVGLGGFMASRQAMPVSDVVGFLMYLSCFTSPWPSWPGWWRTQMAYASAVRVFDVLDAESEVKEEPDAGELKAERGEVSFEQVSFRYEEKEPVLEDVSFTAAPGRMLAIVGPTGEGKSTLISLLERFYDPLQGTIRIDGQDIRGVTLASLRSQISLVLQDTFLFNGTIAQNISYGMPDASVEQIVQAAVTARADGFIQGMPDGYNTVVGERGVRLSGGQKQRLAIARAVLRQTPSWVLDEATSAVDTETECEIQAAIEQLSGTRTIIVIAHRLSTVMRADQILVLHHGRIAEQGTHQELLEKNGVYARLCHVQQRAGADPAIFGREPIKRSPNRERRSSGYREEEAKAKTGFLLEGKEGLSTHPRGAAATP